RRRRRISKLQIFRIPRSFVALRRLRMTVYPHLPVEREPTAREPVHERLEQYLSVSRSRAQERELALSRRAFEMAHVQFADALGRCHTESHCPSRAASAS